MGIAEMTEAVNGISGGTGSDTGTSNRKDGTFTTNNFGKATVNCGFKPDLITVYLQTYNNGDDTIEEGFSIPFSEQTYPKMPYCTLSYHRNGIYEVTATKTSAGFAVEITDLGWGAAHNLVKNKSFSYKAVKFT